MNPVCIILENTFFIRKKNRFKHSCKHFIYSYNSQTTRLILRSFLSFASVLIVVLFHILLLLVTYINPISLQCNNKANNYLRDEKIVFLTILHKNENWTFQGLQQLISLNRREEEGKKKSFKDFTNGSSSKKLTKALRHGDTCTSSPHHTKMNLFLTSSQFIDPNSFPSPM